MKKILSTIIILFLFFLCIAAQTNNIKAILRYSFYSNELFGEIIVNIPANYNSNRLVADIIFEDKVLARGIALDPSLNNYIEFPVGELPLGISYLDVIIRKDLIELPSIKVKIVKLEHKLNEVKIDYASGGLVVDNLPFFPFGFYCYSPVQPSLAEEEVVKGFNMISPYQKILKETINDRKIYMDRCAELGMRVHYNLLSVAGGGGVGSDIVDNTSERGKLSLLIDEIEAFRDHPALLAWYISDEPTGHKISPEKLEETYQLIKELDPYHPVSIVFMASQRAGEYAGAMDIIMADPYPLPNGSVLEVDKVARNLKKEFNLEKPVWIVPQAFGGSEWWLREPTAAELRVMTYLSVINKATGIQYFVRHGLNSFPKSTETWSECGVMALEMAELTPFLLSIEQAPDVVSNTPGIKINSWEKDGTIIIMVVNTINKPTDLDIQIRDMENAKLGGQAKLIFENRSVQCKKGKISDMIDAFGTRVYQISSTDNSYSGLIKGNLVHDPGFEDNPSVGTPAYCYAKNKGDRGATYFIDSRVAFQGNHSIRLVTPKENEGMSLKFFPLQLKKGKTYKISIWAMAKAKTTVIPKKQGFFKRIFSKKETVENSKAVFELALAAISSKRFELGEEWKEYSFTIRLSSNGKETIRGGPVLSLVSQATAWFDLLQVVQVN